jgi:hypothetical protein
MNCPDPSYPIKAPVLFVGVRISMPELSCPSSLICGSVAEDGSYICNLLLGVVVAPMAIYPVAESNPIFLLVPLAIYGVWALAADPTPTKYSNAVPT